jgi:cobalt-zinc-cadmium efflux system protein
VSHHHHHDHGHTHQSEFNRAFLIAIVANSLFVVCQIIVAYTSHSTSLLADAVHNFGDVLGLVMAWVGQLLLKRSPTAFTTYGMKKTSILTALANGLVLVFSCGMIATEALYRLFTPIEIHASYIIIVAAIGIVVNGATAALFLRGSDDLNIRAAFMHLAYDALISLGVVLSATLLYYTGWLWLDPLVGLLIAVIILKGTWGLFTDSFRLIIDGVPRGIILTNVHELLSEQAGVRGVHDLHVWALSTQENALSVHLWMPEQSLSDAARDALIHRLRKEHHIHHTTIQVEQAEGCCTDACSLYL